MQKKLKNKELNLLLALDRKQTSAPRRTLGGYRSIILPFALVILVLAALTTFLFFSTSSLEAERDEVLAYLNDPSTQEGYKEALRWQNAVADVQSRSEELQSVLDNLAQYPDLSSADWKQVFRIAGGRVQMSNFSYDRATGTFLFTARTTSAARVPLFISALRKSKIFADVVYTGYIGGEVETTTGKKRTTAEYVFNVACLVRMPSEKGVE